MTKLSRITVLAGISLACAGLIAWRSGSRGEPEYEGRTVEDWLYNSNWEKDQNRIGLPLLMMGDRALDPLSRILARRTPNWEVKLAWKLPLGYVILHRPLANVVIKEHALAAIETLGLRGEKLVPDVTRVAQDRTEFHDIRQLAFNYLHRKAGLCKRDTFLSMTNDPDFGPQAVRVLSEIDTQARNREQREIEQEIAAKLEARKDPLATNTLFDPNRRLWNLKSD